MLFHLHNFALQHHTGITPNFIPVSNSSIHGLQNEVACDLAFFWKGDQKNGYPCVYNQMSLVVADCLFYHFFPGHILINPLSTRGGSFGPPLGNIIRPCFLTVIFVTTSDGFLSEAF